jgi:molybdopterin converting factor small subunit
MANQSEVEVDAETVGAALDQLALKFGPGFRNSLFDKEGKIIFFYRVYVDKEQVPLSDVYGKKPKDGDVVHIFPPVIGGSP